MGKIFWNITSSNENTVVSLTGWWAMFGLYVMPGFCIAQVSSSDGCFVLRNMDFKRTFTLSYIGQSQASFFSMFPVFVLSYANRLLAVA